MTATRHDLLRICQSESLSDSPIQMIYGCPNPGFVQIKFKNAKKQMWISYYVNLSDCIVWNHYVWTAEAKIRKKQNKTTYMKTKNNLLTFFSAQGTAKRNYPTTTKSPRHHRPQPTETPSCAKRWSSVAAVQRAMKSVCEICRQRKKKELSVDFICILGFLENTRDRFLFT